MISIALNEKLAKIADSAYFEYNMWSDIKEVLYNLNINFINLDYNCLKIFCNRQFTDTFILYIFIFSNNSTMHIYTLNLLEAFLLF